MWRHFSSEKCIGPQIFFVVFIQLDVTTNRDSDSDSDNDEGAPTLWGSDGRISGWIVAV